MARVVAYKRGVNKAKSNFRSGLCFTVSYDRLEQLLRQHNLLLAKIKDNEQIERVEIDEMGITVFLESVDKRKE